MLLLLHYTELVLISITNILSKPIKFTSTIGNLTKTILNNYSLTFTFTFYNGIIFLDFI